MNRKRTLTACLLILILLAGCGFPGIAAAPETEEGDSRTETLYVRPVENMPEDFFLGMDVSSVIAEEQSGVTYRDFDGTEKDLFEILASCGINLIRVRIWNDPYDAEGNGYGGGNCDIETACRIGRRAAENGMRLLVDFHYSDFWADPGKQAAPKAWAGMELEEKCRAAYRFTESCLRKLRQAGADIALVQLGNETNGALAGETDWPSVCLLLQAGGEAVRKVCPEALTAVHFTNPEKPGSYALYADKLAEYEVDYDVFASSYYPYWHGTLENLAAVLSDIAGRYGKKVMVAETAYPYTGMDTDFSGNTVSGEGFASGGYPFSVQGQADCVRDVADAVVNRMKNGIGVCYWEGAWISVGTSSWEENHEIWEKYGSGWASSYAAEYDPEDAGRWYGGCAVDNQAFFDEQGRPLESLKVFTLIRNGTGSGN